MSNTGTLDASCTLRDAIAAWSGPPITLMEVCGSHTMAIAQAGITSLLPKTIRLVSGPGCPVCVTPVGYIDHALAIAELPAMTVTTFGDLMRVPGSAHDRKKHAPTLLRARAGGADVRVVYSPRDALLLARAHRDRQVVFLGVGFETTAPVIAATMLEADAEGLENFSVLSANKTVPEAMEALVSTDKLSLDGFLCPGHVSVIIGPEPYQGLVERKKIPCAIAGFEPLEILAGIQALLTQIAAGRPRVDVLYGAVKPGGNRRARKLLYRVFEPADTRWRGLGVIPCSGLRIRRAYAHLNAAERFDVQLVEPLEARGCRCGDVLRGLLDPKRCPLFGGACTPDNPLGACMVSSEGSCAARFTYGAQGGDSPAKRSAQ